MLVVNGAVAFALSQPIILEQFSVPANAKPATLKLLLVILIVVPLAIQFSKIFPDPLVDINPAAEELVFPAPLFNALHPLIRLLVQLFKRKSRLTV